MEQDLKVGDNYRKSELSITPGGAVVKVIYNDGKRLVYDKIKNPAAYIEQIKKDSSIFEIWVNDQKHWSR